MIAITITMTEPPTTVRRGKAEIAVGVSSAVALGSATRSSSAPPDAFGTPTTIAAIFWVFGSQGRSHPES
jgi:hypothetical protein